jgi:transposase
MPETRRSYDSHFKEGAVQVVRETGRSIARVAEELGVPQGDAHQLGERRPPTPRGEGRPGHSGHGPGPSAGERERRTAHGA